MANSKRRGLSLGQQAFRQVAKGDEFIQSRLRVPEENYYTKPGGPLGSINRSIRAPLHAGNPWSDAPVNNWNTRFDDTAAGWAGTAVSRGIQAGIAGAGLTTAGVGLLALTDKMGATFGGPADHQEPNQLRL